MSYAGFWRRFGAFWLDVVVLSPLTGLTLWGFGHYRLFNLYYFFPGIIIGLCYSVYLVRRFGGTPGKLVAGLRIRKTDGSQIGYREAFLRYLPEMLLVTVMSVATIYSTLSMTDAEYLSLSFIGRSERIIALAPPWYKSVNIVLQIWTWSEFIIMMTNRKRRALHDFIAGTIVILHAQNNAPQPTDTSSPRHGEQPGN